GGTTTLQTTRLGRTGRWAERDVGDRVGLRRFERVRYQGCRQTMVDSRRIGLRSNVGAFPKGYGGRRIISICNCSTTAYRGNSPKSREPKRGTMSFSNPPTPTLRAI